MTLTQPGRASYRWLTITLLVAAGVYGWYASTQYARLNDLNQRQLSNAAAELKGALQTAVETATRFNDKRAKWIPKPAASTSVDPNEPRLCDFDDNQPYLDLAACADSATPVGDKTNATASVQPFTSPTLGIKVTDAAGHGDFRYRFRADKILRELAFPDAFALIFVATSEGEILYQDAPARRRWLRHLRWGEQMFRDGNADRSPVLQIQNLQQVVAGGEETWKQLRAMTSRTRVQLGGTAHQLYLQPLVLEHGQRTVLLVGGAVPTKTIVTDALALETPLVAVLVFLLLLGVLGFPFVKLASLAPRERFRLRDVHLLYISTGALLVLMTCGSLALDGYFRWRAAADTGLEALAKDLESRFLTEVTAIRDEVAGYDALVRKVAVSKCETWGVQTRWYKENPETSSHNQAALPSDYWIPWPTRNVHLRLVGWIRSDGMQIWKATADAIPGKLPVSQRAYFRAVQNRSLFRLAEKDQEFFIGPDRSITDGKFYTFFSMPSAIPRALCNPDAAPGTPVVSTVAYLLSLDKQPLPAGYGFALINREGRVLYHSDGRLSLREDLYDELSEGARVRAMVYANGQGLLATGYRERPHRLFLHPVALRRADDGSPAGFYLVTFRDLSAERTLVGHVFVAGLIVPMALFIAVYGAAVWGLARLSRPVDRLWSAWLWPHGGLNHVYRRQSIALAALLAASAGYYIISGSLAAFLLLPIVAAALAVGIYAHGSRRRPERCPLCAPGWHTASVLFIMVCLVVTPCSAVFRLALSHEFAKLILTEHRWIESQRHDMPTAAAVETLTDDYYFPTYADALKQARREYFGCLPTPFDAADHAVLDPGSPQPRSADVQRAVHVNTQPPSSEMPPAATGRSHRRCERWNDPSSGDVNTFATLQSIGIGTLPVAALHTLDDALLMGNDILARQQFQPREFSFSPDGTWVRPLRTSSIPFLGFGFTLGLLLWWIRWNTNRLFLADQETGAPPAPGSAPIEQVWPTCSVDEQLVLLQTAREGIANPHQRETVKTLVQKGLLQINPNLQPCAADIRTFLHRKDHELQAQVREWEQVIDGSSWRYARLILIASTGALGFFLVATQPSLQSSLMGIASAATAGLTAVFRLREALLAWFPGSKKGA